VPLQVPLKVSLSVGLWDQVPTITEPLQGPAVAPFDVVAGSDPQAVRVPKIAAITKYFIFISFG